MDVEQKVREIICEQLSVEESEVTREASFVETLNADSLDIVELIMAFEEAFNIEIGVKAARGRQDVQGLAGFQLVVGEIGEQPSAFLPFDDDPQRAILHGAAYRVSPAYFLTVDLGPQRDVLPLLITVLVLELGGYVEAYGHRVARLGPYVGNFKSMKM